MLASRVSQIKDGLASQLEGRPFTEAKTRTAALDWWAQHRNDQYGAEILRQMDPVGIAELDAALYQHVNQGETVAQPG
jgi:hypothetical protein